MKRHFQVQNDLEVPGITWFVAAVEVGAGKERRCIACKKMASEPLSPSVKREMWRICCIGLLGTLQREGRK